MQRYVSPHPKIDMEEHGLIVKLIRILTVPILNSIPPSYLQSLIRKSSKYGDGVIDRPGTTHSLETMYTKNRKSGGAMKRIADSFWQNFVSQPKAVRNRLRIVEHHLENELIKILEKKNEIDVLNVGGGSSRAFIEIVQKLSQNYTFKIRITNIDKDSKAIELGKVIADKYGVGDCFTWINDDVRNLDGLLNNDSYDLIEMVGLLDYFNNDSSKRIISNIFKKLRKGGMFIVANIYPNREMKFIEHSGWPRMFYKTEHDLFNILVESGFSEDYATISFEPLKVHIIGIARK